MFLELHIRIFQFSENSCFCVTLREYFFLISILNRIYNVFSDKPYIFSINCSAGHAVVMIISRTNRYIFLSCKLLLSRFFFGMAGWGV